MAKEIKSFDELETGQNISVHQKIKEMNAKGEEKERIQVFSGMLIAHKSGSSPDATITVRKVSNGVPVEKVFPLHLPEIDKITIDKIFKTRRSKLYFTRDSRKKLREIK